MKVILGFFMDLLIGDPRWLPHPVVFIGKAIDRCKEGIQEKIYGCSYEEAIKTHRSRDQKEELLGGGVLTLAVVGGTYLAAAAMLKAAEKIHPRARQALETFLLFQTLAARCLGQEALKVYDKLSCGDLSGARKQVGNLVGRDTEDLSEEEIVKATVETVAENTCDGVAAPMFYGAIGGAPLAMAYKAVNTLDSMVGYRNEEFLYLGRASARMDDLWNLVPSRLSALSMVAGAKLVGQDWRGGLRIFKRDRYKHLSPNSAQTEAVAAGALHIRLGGTHTYFGREVEKPTIGDDRKNAQPEDIKRSVRLMYGASVCFAGAVALVKGVCRLGKRRES